jgi:hypothetical protein
VNQIFNANNAMFPKNLQLNNVSKKTKVTQTVNNNKMKMKNTERDIKILDAQKITQQK